MSDKIKELLAVLNMGATIISANSGKPVINIFDRERKQIEWLCANDIIRHKKYPETFIGDAASNKLQESLADLAFRLRDEAVKTCRYKYDDAIIQVYSVSKKSAEVFHWWWIRHSQPIHIIIAALIAKELAQEAE